MYDSLMGEGRIGIKLKLVNFMVFDYLITLLEIQQAFHVSLSSLPVFDLAMKSSFPPS